MPFPRKVLWTAVIALLAALLYSFYWKLSSGKPIPKKSVRASKRSASADKKEQREKKHRSKTKGVAHQKLEVFVELVAKNKLEVSEEAARALFPRKYEQHGHVVVVRLNQGVSKGDFAPLASFFAQSFEPITVDLVLLDEQGIDGELREPVLETLFCASSAHAHYLASVRQLITRRWQDAKGVQCVTNEAQLTELLTQYATTQAFTVHVENGVRYSFDVSRVMFSSGNTTERMHFATVNASDEVVVDMFAGIGYFTLPLAMHGRPAVVHALEKNPNSVAYLTFNALMNRVGHIVRPQCGDNRTVGDELVGKCDRVLMGYIPTCKMFLNRAASFLKRDDEGRMRGVIHYHFLADKPAAERILRADVLAELGDAAISQMKLSQLRCVKSYAPKRYHYVADLLFDSS